MKGTLVYTQNSVAFPTVAPDPTNSAVYDRVGVSDEADGGGTHGSFGWDFYRFSGSHRGVQLQVFGDGLGTFYDRVVQRVVKAWMRMDDPDEATPADLIALLEAQGVVPSRYHKSGQQAVPRAHV